MAPLAPSNYDNTCQLYWEMPKLIYYITFVKVTDTSIGITCQLRNLV